MAGAQKAAAQQPMDKTAAVAAALSATLIDVGTQFLTLLL
jgi:hypothetical protein